MITVNLTGVQTNVEPVPAGMYLASVQEIKQKVSSSGNPYLSWEFVIEEPQEYAARKLWYNTSLQPHALFSLKRLLEALEYFTAEDLNGQISFEPDDLLGFQVTLVVVDDVYDGKQVSRVDRVLPASAYEG